MRLDGVESTATTQAPLARRYRAPFGIPSVSQEEPSFRPGMYLQRVWRGPSWVNTAWLLAPAMRRLGYAEEADRVTASFVEVVEHHGFREYYNPLNGIGLAARNFGWSTLLVDLLENEQPLPEARANQGVRPQGVRPQGV